MHKLGRTILWLLPFMWPVALWRSIRAGQERRHRELLRALGGEPQQRRRPRTLAGLLMRGAGR